MTGPSGAGPAPPAATVVLGRRTIRVVLWLWLASLAFFTVAVALKSDWFLSAAALIVLTGALLAVLPGAFFVVRTFKGRAMAVPPGLRVSAIGSGIAAAVVGWRVWESSGSAIVAGPVALVGLLIVVRAATVGRGKPAPGAAEVVRLRHAATTIAGVLGVFAATYVLRLSIGTKGSAYVAAMKSDLRSLALAEEAFRADSGRYGERAQLFYASMYGDSVVMTLSADRRGWWAVSSSASSLSRCGVWVGVRPPDGMHGAKEGEPRCW